MTLENMVYKFAILHIVVGLSVYLRRIGHGGTIAAEIRKCCSLCRPFLSTLAERFAADEQSTGFNDSEQFSASPIIPLLFSKPWLKEPGNSAQVTDMETDTIVSDDSEVILSLQDQCFHGNDHLQSRLPIFPNAAASTPKVSRADPARKFGESAASTGSLRTCDPPLQSLQSFGIIGSSFHCGSNDQFMSTVVQCGNICSDAEEEVGDADETQFIEPSTSQHQSPVKKTVGEETPGKQAQAVSLSGLTYNMTEMTSSLISVKSASDLEVSRSPAASSVCHGCDTMTGCELEVTNVDHQPLPYTCHNMTRPDSAESVAVTPCAMDQVQSLTSSERCSLKEIPCSLKVQNLPVMSASVPVIVAVQEDHTLVDTTDSLYIAEDMLTNVEQLLGKECYSTDMSWIKSTLLQVKNRLVNLYALYQRETANIASNMPTSQTNQTNDRTSFVQQAKVLCEKQKRLVKAFELSKRLSAKVEQVDVELSCDSQTDLFIERRSTRSTATNEISAPSTTSTGRCANTASVRSSQYNKISNRTNKITEIDENLGQNNCSPPSTTVQHLRKKVEKGIVVLNCSNEVVPLKRRRAEELEMEAASKSQCNTLLVGMYGACLSKKITTDSNRECCVSDVITENVECPERDNDPSPKILVCEASTADVINTSSLPPPCSPVVSSVSLVTRPNLICPLSSPVEDIEQIICLSSPEVSQTILSSAPVAVSLPLVACSRPVFSGTQSQDVPLWKRMGLPPPPPSPSSVSSCSPHLHRTRLTSLQKEDMDCFDKLSMWTSKEIPVQSRQQMPLKIPVASKELTMQKPGHSRQLAGNGTVSRWLAALPDCVVRDQIATFKKPSMRTIEKCRGKAVPRCYPSVVKVTHNAISSVAGSVVSHFATITPTASSTFEQERLRNVQSQSNARPTTTLTTTSEGKSDSKVKVKSAVARRGLKLLLADEVIKPGSNVMSLISPQGDIHLANLRPSGHIEDSQGRLHSTPSSWCKAVLGLEAISAKTVHNMVLYNDVPLAVHMANNASCQRTLTADDSVGGNEDFSQHIVPQACPVAIALSKNVSCQDTVWTMPRLTSKTVVHMHDARELCLLPVNKTLNSWAKEQLSSPLFLDCIDKWN